MKYAKQGFQSGDILYAAGETVIHVSIPYGTEYVYSVTVSQNGQ